MSRKTMLKNLLPARLAARASEPLPRFLADPRPRVTAAQSASPVRAVSRRCILSGAAAASVGGWSSAHATHDPAKGPFRAAWVYVSPVAPTGWTRQHDEGRKAAQQAIGTRLRTHFVENVAEGADAERVIRDLSAQGYDLVFTPSFGYMEPTLKVAREFPGVKFESITGYKRAANVATANARYYEGRYLAGIAAGRCGTRLGYAAGFPIPEVLQGINAFALGARSVNPEATVRVVWLNEWFNPAKEREAALALFNQGVEVLAFHTGSSAPMAAARERGKLAIGYHSDMSAAGGDAQLLAVTHHWGSYYAQRIRDAIEGRWQSTDTWGGMAQGMVGVGHFGPRLSDLAKRDIAAAQAAMASGTLRPFATDAQAIRDNAGTLRIEPGRALTDVSILSMNWLVEGVLGKV
jgi:basic membrane protein A and related proteins